MYERHTRIRYFLRTAKPSIPFIPIGLIGLLMICLPVLFIFLSYAKSNIQNSVKTAVEQALKHNDLASIKVEVNGQNVVLSGADSQALNTRAIEIAEQVKGSTLFGPLIAAISVDGAFLEESTKPTAAKKLSHLEKAAASSSTKKTQKNDAIDTKKVFKQAAQWGDISAALNSGTLTISGLVSSKSQKSALLEVLEKELGKPHLTQIDDQLSISQDPLKPESFELAKRTLRALPICIAGQAAITQGKVSINCQAPMASATQITQMITATIDEEHKANISISIAQDCKESIEKTLRKDTIKFEINSAELKTQYTQFLDDIAELATTCSSKLHIEGHTDATGSLQANMTLSKRRALSVVNALVTRGVDASRLMHKGYGPTKPAAKGNSRDSLAHNRRAEIHLSDD